MLKVQPISAEGLWPHATLIVSNGGRRTPFPDALRAGPGEGEASLSVIRFEAVPELVVRRLERHPHAAQTFFPLTAGRFFVVVAGTLADGLPDVASAQALLAGPGHAISYRRNAWHASMLVLEGPSDMAVVMWRRAAGDDTVVHDLDEPLMLRLP